MGDSMYSWLKWSLVTAAVLGLIYALTMVPAIIDYVGRPGSIGGPDSLMVSRTLWGWLTKTGAGLMIVGSLVSLLLVAGRWPSRTLAAGVLAYYLVTNALFANGGPMFMRMATTGEVLPQVLRLASSAALLALMSTVALFTGLRLARSSRAGAPVSDRPSTPVSDVRASGGGV